MASGASRTSLLIIFLTQFLTLSMNLAQLQPHWSLILLNTSGIGLPQDFVLLFTSLGNHCLQMPHGLSPVFLRAVLKRPFVNDAIHPLVIRAGLRRCPPAHEPRLPLFMPRLFLFPFI